MQGFEILMVEKLGENGERFRGLLWLKNLCQMTQGFKASATDKKIWRGTQSLAISTFVLAFHMRHPYLLHLGDII
jgi:hypothetical protein